MNGVTANILWEKKWQVHIKFYGKINDDEAEEKIIDETLCLRPSLRNNRALTYRLMDERKMRKQ